MAVSIDNPKANKANKNLDKVAAARIANPGATVREIAKQTGVSKSSVDRADKKLGQIGTKYPRIEQLIEGDMQLFELGQRFLTERVLDPLEREKISSRDLNAITDSSHKRYMLFRGDATDEHGGLAKETLEFYNNRVYENTEN